MAASRSISRALIELPPVRVRPSAYVCRSCRRSLQRSFSTTQTRPVASEEIPFTEKVRRKLWGTDNPPGLKDPYGGPSFLERRRMEREAKQQAQAEEQPEEPLQDYTEYAAAESEREPYTPAETWDGLEHVGHVGEWQDLEEVPAEKIEHFLQPATTQQPPSLEDLTLAMYRAISEPSTSPPASTTATQLPADASWLEARLDFSDPVTFQILTQFSLLTNTRIPDPVLSSHLTSPTATIQSLLIGLHTRLVKSSRPKLADKLSQTDEIATAANVMVFRRRESKIDKEKELGRWKVIERELRERGLPVVQGA